MGDKERAAEANRTTLGFHIGRCVGISMGLLLFVGVHDCANEFMLESKSNTGSAFIGVIFQLSSLTSMHSCLIV